MSDTKRKKRSLEVRLFQAVKGGDRRPEVLVLLEKIRRCPAYPAQGYEHALRWLGL